ncbi:hypothetical protein [Paenibacillus alkalitolerans]|uniref:hypothetical protein n=1 Tax=Paenibacillus alkalitolerans TaxID=2799335 RepID=UPI0018F66C42|nr:hypothetical protein [Paenibacillus alkalitolerans]
MHASALKSSDVRKNFREVVDTVIHKAPAVVNRHSDHFIMINTNQFAAALQYLQFNVTVEPDSDGSFLATSIEIDDIFASGETREEAVNALAKELVEYAQEYMDQDHFYLHFNAPNRKGHFPYVLKIMMQDSLDAVVSLLDVKYKRL